MVRPPLQAKAASMSRIPSLDGLRAISIFLVVALHTIQRYSVTHHVPRFWHGIFAGGTGVFIFFVISGYLITSLLLDEQQKTGTISRRGFYIRRALRILPPLYMYVAVVLLLGLAGRLASDKLDIISALFFFHDYAPSFMWSLEHFWSLSIEEQFYLIWPFVLIYCLRRPGIEGRMLAGKIAIAVILIEPFIRVVSFLVPNPYIHNATGFHMRADSLMFGCVVALFEGTPTFERIYCIATKIWWIPPAVILISDLLGSRFENYWQFPFGFTIAGVAIATFLLWSVRNPASIVGRLLNSRPLVHIGVLSYSIYLWQTLLLRVDSSAFGPLLRFFSTFPGNWLVILIVAELSYHLVEKPALRLRNRLLRPAAVRVAQTR